MKILLMLVITLLCQTSKAATEANHIAGDLANEIWRGSVVNRDQWKYLFEELRPFKTGEGVAFDDRSEDTSGVEKKSSAEFIDELGSDLREIMPSRDTSGKVISILDDLIKTLHSFEGVVDPSILECGINLVLEYMNI